MSDLPRKLELGCGEIKPEGFFGVDIQETEASDKKMDLDSFPWDLPDNHFEHIRAIDLFEHIENPIKFMEEIHRIGKEGCIVEIRAPHMSSQNWTDPTHQRLCGWNTISNYFTKSGKFSFYSTANFQILHQELQVNSRKIHWPQRVLKPFFNRFPEIYENTFIRNLFPVQNIYYKLKVDR